MRKRRGREREEKKIGEAKQAGRQGVKACVGDAEK